MMLNPQLLKKYLLCCNNIKLPITNTHYITGKDIYVFSNFACIENTLTCFTNNFKCLCKNFTNKIYH